MPDTATTIEPSEREKFAHAYVKTMGCTLDYARRVFDHAHNECGGCLQPLADARDDGHFGNGSVCMTCGFYRRGTNA